MGADEQYNAHEDDARFALVEFYDEYESQTRDWKRWAGVLEIPQEETTPREIATSARTLARSAAAAGVVIDTRRVRTPANDDEMRDKRLIRIEIGGMKAIERENHGNP